MAGEGFYLSRSFSDFDSLKEAEPIQNEKKESAAGEGLESVLVKIVIKYKYYFLLVAIIGIIAGIATYTILPKEYSSSVTIMCKIATDSDKEVKKTLNMVNKNIGMIKGIVLSSGITKNQVIRYLKQRHLLTNDVQRELERLSLASLFDISVDTRVKDIIYVSSTFREHKRIPAELANYFAYHVIDAIIKKITEIYKNDISVLRRLLVEKQRERDLINQEMILYLKNSDAVLSSIGSQYIAKEIYKMDDLLQQALMEKSALELEIQTFKKQLGIQGVPLDQIHWISGENIIVQKLEELKVRRKELLAKYTSDNPLVKQIDYQIGAVKQILDSNRAGTDNQKTIVVNMSKSGMVTELALKYARFKSIDKQINFLKMRKQEILNKLLKMPTMDAQLKALKAKLQIVNDSIDDILSDIDNKSTFLGKLKANIQIVKKASVPGSPSFPSKNMFYFGVPAIFLAVLLFVIIMRYLFSPVILDSIDASIKLKIKCLATVAPCLDKSKQARIAKMQKVFSRVVSRLLRLHPASPIIMVSSSSHNEGKTFIASYFAIVAALLDLKTLFIKLPDPESKAVHKEKKGLVNYFESEDIVDEWNYIWKTDYYNLYYLPPGDSMNKKQLLTLISRERISDLFYFAKSHFDLIVLDGGSIPASRETIMFAQQVDAMLFVAASKKTKVSNVNEVIDIIGRDRFYMIINYVPKQQLEQIKIKAKKAIYDVAMAIKMMGAAKV